VTFVIAAPCIDHQDQECMSVCPVDCITYEAGDRKAYIDPEGCIGCGACVRACPQGAIFEAKRLPAAWSSFAEVDRGWFIDPDWARAAVDELAAA
jgi:NAD-dependent dihydropyrimidine dehydrogenase PreA subunit